MLYRLAGIDPSEEQSWIGYALAMLWFHLVGIAMLYALLRLQNVLPLNPQQFDAMSPDLALNTAVSFATNTSWQSYGGETTLGYLSQMAGIIVQSFLSAATGIAVAIALVRGFARRSSPYDRQLLGRSDAHHALCAAADLHRRRPDPGLAGRAADLRRHMSRPRRWKARSRCWRAGRSPRRWRSSC